MRILRAFKHGFTESMASSKPKRVEHFELCYEQEGDQCMKRFDTMFDAVQWIVSNKANMVSISKHHTTISDQTLDVLNVVNNLVAEIQGVK